MEITRTVSLGRDCLGKMQVFGLSFVELLASSRGAARAGHCSCQESRLDGLTGDQPSFPPSHHLSVCIKTTHTAPWLGVFTDLFLRQCVHQSHLTILDTLFLHPMQLSYLSLCTGPGLVQYLPQTHSLFILSQEHATDFTFISSLALGGKKSGGSRTRLNSACRKNQVVAHTHGTLGRKRVSGIGLCCDSKSCN